MPNRFKSLLEVLAQADVQFILIAGVAANLCGLCVPPATLSRSECGRVSCGYCCFLLNDA
jgi:hypothetical protein